MLISQGQYKKVKAHVISHKSLFWGKSLSLGNLRIVLQVGEMVSPPTPTFVYLCLRFMPMRFAIFMINICIYIHPFKVFMNRKYEGLKISCVAKLERPIDSGDFSYENGFDEVFMK